MRQVVAGIATSTPSGYILAMVRRSSSRVRSNFSGNPGLDRRQAAGLDADDLMDVAIAALLDPGHPAVPGTIALLLLPAQQVSDDAVAHLD